MAEELRVLGMRGLGFGGLGLTRFRRPLCNRSATRKELPWSAFRTTAARDLVLAASSLEVRML